MCFSSIFRMCSRWRISHGVSREFLRRRMEVGFWTSFILNRMYFNLYSSSGRSGDWLREQLYVLKAFLLTVFSRGNCLQSQSHLGFRRHQLLLTPHPRRALRRPHPSRHSRLCSITRNSQDVEHARSTAHLRVQSPGAGGRAAAEPAERTRGKRRD